MIKNITKLILAAGGRIKPLIIPPSLSGGTGQMNPSVLICDGKTIINLRNVGYVLVHSENQQQFQSRWGPLAYLHPENDQKLRTTNFNLEINADLEIVRTSKVDTSRLDVQPVWEFVGLEDARLVRWNNRLYMCGVRRDTKPNGEGRMELSEIEIDGNVVNETGRYRIEPPGVPSYCEKNWMPILDMPLHFVKWCNPTEVVKVNLETLTSETVFLGAASTFDRDLRGGSQVIPFENHRVALTHEVVLFNNELGRKDAYYYHRFIAWDRDWNIAAYSDRFSFMDARIEFSCGMALNGNNFLITFGFQDNTAYVLEVPGTFIKKLIYGD